MLDKKSLLKFVLEHLSGSLHVARKLEGDGKKIISRKISTQFNGYGKIIFIQVGPDIGKQGDPIHSLINNDDRYVGIFVEPVKSAYERLKGNYGEGTRFQFCNRAVSGSKNRTFYYVSEEAKGNIQNLPEWCNQLGSFDRNHIVNYLNGDLGPYIKEETTHCSNINDLIREYNLEGLNLLHINTQGFALDILKTLTIHKYLPSVILYKSKHLHLSDAKEARKLLTGNNYKLYIFRNDVLGIQRNNGPYR